jgi:hypothetical protein
MPTRPAAPAAILTALVALSPTPAAAQMTRGRITLDKQITLERARAILGTNPVAIPGYPVRLYALSHAVLVRQELDSGMVIQLAEDAQSPIIGSSRCAWCSASDTSVYEDGPRRVLLGYPTRIEDQYWSRQSSRKVGGVNVRYLGSRNGRIPYDLLDRLAPIQ